VSKLAMTSEELDDFLTEERVLRLATVDDEGWPAVVPLWFVWHDGAIWIWNLTRSKRTRRLHEGTRCAVTVDTGREYTDLRGVTGRVDHAHVPDDEVPVAVRAAFSRKYLGTDEPLEPADHHEWFRLDPHALRSWDFRKLGG
jgi:nitroimidazol reductase NimA-like FMN-containing flavoprotein (pyridoxamine 5'-phosphate oxidase superfamily)